MLNPASPTPLYHQLAQALADGIRGGSLQPGDRLPSEPELARQHGIGRPTVRQATELLVRRGLVERRRGAGTFVRSRPAVDVFSLAGAVSAFRSEGLTLRTQLLRPAAYLDVQAGTHSPFAGRRVFELLKLGRVDGVPVLTERVELDPSIFRDIEQLPLDGVSLSELVREHYHLEPNHGEQTFNVDYPPEEVRAALELRQGSATLLVRRTLDFPNAPCALFSELHCRTDRIVFTQRLGEPQT